MTRGRVEVHVTITSEDGRFRVTLTNCQLERIRQGCTTVPINDDDQDLVTLHFLFI